MTTKSKAEFSFQDTMAFSKIKTSPLLLLLIISNAIHANPIQPKEGEEPTKPNKEDYILKNVVTPSSYELTVTLPEKFETLKTFDGVVKIETVGADNPNSNNVITLNSNNIDLNSITPKVLENGKDNVMESIELKPELQMLEILINRPIKKGSTYTIEIKYKGKLEDDMYGFYKSSYKNEKGETEWIATTQFQPTHARRAFPCFDEPKYKATFTLTLNYPKAYHALSNTKGITTSTGDVKKTIFEPTPKMSTYLLAFVVSKYASINSHEDDKIQHSAWSPIETIDSAAYALNLGPKLIKAMEDFTKIPYDLEKLDQISIPDFSAGAMENWGLVTYRETALLWNPSESGARNKQRVATVVAHEFSHMWFGNLITTEWWSSTWLNEGFARYFEYHATAKVETDWDLEKQFIVEQHQAILNSDALSNVPALTSEAYTPSDISSKFGSITYSKGGSIVRMMEKFMGSTAFFKGIQAYLDAHKEGNTIPKNLFDKLDANVDPKYPLPANKKIIDIMQTWTTVGGFPYVTVSRDANTLKLKQEQFLFDTTTEDNKWYIPITYTTSNKKEFEITAPTWLLPIAEDTPLENVWTDETNWVVLNLQASAYIRVNYDTNLWKALEAALKKEDFDNIEAISRSQIVDDSLNFARAGIINYERGLDNIQYLEKETDYYPWYSAFNAFAYLKRRINSESELSKLLDKHIIRLMSGVYKSISFKDDLSKQTEIFKQSLALKWACNLGVEDCVKTSLEQFDHLKKFNVQITPNLRSVIYCTAVRDTDSQDNWNFLWKRFEETRLAHEISTLITALGCTKDKELLNKYLTTTITVGSSVRRQDAQSVFTSVISGNPEGVDIGLEFLENNVDDMLTYYGSFNAMTSVLAGIADRLTTKEQIDRLKAFVDKNREKLKDAAVTADVAIASAETNLKWVEDNQEALLTYLKAKEGGGGGGNAAAILASFSTIFFCVLATLF